MSKLKPLSATFFISVGLFTITSYLPDLKAFRTPPKTQADVEPSPIDVREIYGSVFTGKTGTIVAETIPTITETPQITETPIIEPTQDSNTPQTDSRGITADLFTDSSTTITEEQVLGEQTQQEENQDITSEETDYIGTIKIIGPNIGVEPINRTASIIIPKIGVNSPIALDTPVNDRQAYMKALEIGVAHAKGTSLPTDEPNTNTYLFAHSTANEANIARYAAVFTKTKQLTLGDKITVFHNNKRFDYEITQQEVVPSFDTTVLTRKHDYPALTLQTCDPPGNPINRFLTTAKLIGVYDK
ncbi:sortase [candidate division WWE3 bacterium]|nr:sortase [candidate division WWE3 bacterium]